MKQFKTITVDELTEMSQKMYDGLVKGVVDLKKKTLVLDADMHADEEQLLIESGSKQEDLWGINLYPAKYGSDKFVEFDSMISIRPRQNNMTRGVEDESVRKQIVAIVDGIVKK